MTVISRQDMEFTSLWRLDDKISTVTSIEWGHRLIHEGRAWRYHEKFTLTASGDVKRYLLTAAVGFDAHFLVSFSSDQKIDYALYHAPTLTSNGTDVTNQALNRKIGVSGSPSSVIYSDPIPTADGTMIDGYYLDKGIFSRQDDEFELEPGETVMAVFVAQKDEQIVHLSIDWYEEQEN